MIERHGNERDAPFGENRSLSNTVSSITDVDKSVTTKSIYSSIRACHSELGTVPCGSIVG